MKQDFYKYFKLCLNEDKLPHAFLIETSNVEEMFDDIIVFFHENNLIQNKVYINNTNLIMIEPDGKEIKSDSINNLQKKFMTKPVNDKYNIYIIKNAEKMNISSANKILKFLEEPQPNILGILISSNSQILPTIKSRCQIFKMINSDNLIETEEDSNKLIYLLKDLNIRNEIELKKYYSTFDRTNLINVILNSINKYNSINSDQKISLGELQKNSKIILILDKILRLLKSNVNIDLVLDKLCIEVKD